MNVSNLIYSCSLLTCTFPAAFPYSALKQCCCSLEGGEEDDAVVGDSEDEEEEDDQMVCSCIILKI